MESPSGNYRPQIIVALIGVTGVLGASVLSNWDKLTGTRAAVQAPVSGAQPVVAAPPADAVKDLGDAQRNSYGAATAALEDVAQQISSAAIPDISGNWRSPDGYAFQVEQNGRAYSFQQYAPNGAWVGSGSGQLVDRKVQHDFQAPSMNVASGQCSGDVAADGRSISGSCFDRSGGSRWGFRIDR